MRSQVGLNIGCARRRSATGNEYYTGTDRTEKCHLLVLKVEADIAKMRKINAEMEEEIAAFIEEHELDLKALKRRPTRGCVVYY